MGTIIHTAEAPHHKFAWLHHAARLLAFAPVPAVAGVALLAALAQLPWTPGAAQALGNVHYYSHVIVDAFTLVCAVILIAVQPSAAALYLLYGARDSTYEARVAWRLALRCGVPAACATGIFYGTWYALRIDMWYYGIQFGAYVLYTLSMAAVAWQTACVVPQWRHSHLRRRFVLSGLVTPCIVYVLVRAVRVYRATQNEWGHVLFRVVGVPLVAGGTQMLLAAYVHRDRVLPPVLCNSLLLPLRYFVALYGRLLITTFTNTRLAVLTSILVAAGELVWRITVHQRFSLARRLNCCCYRKQQEQHRRQHLLASLANLDVLVELVATVLAPALYVLFFKHRALFDFTYEETRVPMDHIALRTGIQLAAEMVVVVVVVWYHSSAGYNLRDMWYQERARARMAMHVLYVCGLLMFALTVFYTRPFFLFCTAPYPCACSNMPLHATACSGVTLVASQ